MSSAAGHQLSASLVAYLDDSQGRVLVAGCSARRPAQRTDANTSEPRLISCHNPNPADSNAKGGPITIAMSLRFVVTADGRVDPGSIRVARYEGKPPSNTQIEEAKAQAISCTFEPAIRGMYPAAAEVTRTFRVLSTRHAFPGTRT